MTTIERLKERIERTTDVGWNHPELMEHKKGDRILLVNQLAIMQALVELLEVSYPCESDVIDPSTAPPAGTDERPGWLRCRIKAIGLGQAVRDFLQSPTACPPPAADPESYHRPVERI